MIPVSTYMVKIKPISKVLNVQKRVIEILKEEEWIVAVEKMNNPLCFYVETTSPLTAEQVFADLKIYFLQQKIADVLYSKIDTVYTNSRKELRNVRRVQG